MAVLAIVIVAHRRFPFAGPAAYWLLAAGIAFVDPILLPSAESFFAVGLATAFLLGNLRDARKAGIGLAIILASTAILVAQIPGHTTAEVFFIPLDFAICWFAGFMLRETADQAQAAEARAIVAEHDREADALRAVVEERTRIARELHDIVGHSVSVMTVQTSGVRRLLRPEQEQEREALLAVERTGREALAEMRRVVGALRDPEGGPALAPQPSLSRIDTLVAHARETGLPVDLEIEGEPVPLPAGVDLTAYRLVQEGLTNAIKHACGEARRRSGPLRRRPRRDRGVRRRPGGRWRGRRRRRRTRPGGHARARVDLRRRARGGSACRGRVPAPSSAPGGDMTLGVLIADDQALMRAGFRMILEAEPDLEVVGEATTGDEAVAEVGRLRPDVVLMDVRMPEMDGIEATRRLLDGNDGTKVVMLTTFDMDEYVYEAFRAGASGFLVKDVPPEQLIAGIRSVASGDALLAPSVTQRLIQEFVRRPPNGVRTPPPELARLTAREVEVLRMMARGLSNAEIATELFVSETTVKTHVAHLLSKLGVRDRVQAVVFAYESGVVQPGETS